MNLLFATSIVPDGALASGYEIANAAIIDALRRAGANVTVIGFTWPGKPASDPDNTIVLGSVDVRTESASGFQKLAWIANAILSGLTFASVKLRVIADEDVKSAIRRAGPFDAYVLNSVQFAGAFDGLFNDKPTIFVAHNVEHRSALENAASTRNPLLRMVYRREARLVKRVEERLCAKANFVFTLAQDDSAALGVASNQKSRVLPLVTTPAVLEKTPRQIECDAALIGTWTWQPNRIGLDWFLSDVVPHLPADFRLRIAGRAPAGLSSPHPGIEFVGRVPDACEFVRSARVIPLISTAGSGVQLKTIETFELGLPSVATSRSLRGIDHLPDNCIVADDPVAFAKALVAAASGTVGDVDGKAFHMRQLKALDCAIDDGLRTISHSRQEVLA